MAASKSDKPKADKKVFDVAKPGKSTPDATGRPVIVGHKPMIQDPMVNAEAENPSDMAAEQEEKATSTRSVKKIVPLSDQKKEKVEDTSPETVGEDGAEETPTLETEKETKSDEAPSDTSDEQVPLEAKLEESPAAEEDTAPAPNTDDSAAVDALANQAAAKKKEGDLSEEDKKRAEAINKLIEDKTYYVRVGQAHQQRNMRLIIILIIIALAVAGAALAMDAGLIQSTIELPFDIIPN